MSFCQTSVSKTLASYKPALWTFLALGVALLLLPACSRHDNDRSEAESVATDSLQVEEAVPETLSILLDTITTSEAALQYMEEADSAERYQKGILPRMARENLDYCLRLLKSPYSHFLVVDKRNMKVFYIDSLGCIEKEYGIACGKGYGTKHKKRDMRTPEGFFSVEGVYDSTDWLYTDDDGYTSPKKGQFGPRFIRLKIPNTSQIGIHGTCSRGSIGHRTSHGCIRVLNENILELAPLVKKGMPVIVNPGTRDRQVNADEGYDVPYINVEGTAPAVKPQNKEPEATDSTATEKPAVCPEENDSVSVKPAVPDTVPAEPAETPATEATSGQEEFIQTEEAVFE